MTREIDRIVGRNIRLFRHARQWRQADLADRIGCTQAALSHWERGAHALTLEYAALIAAALDIEIALLLSPDDLPRNRYLRATRGPAYFA